MLRNSAAVGAIAVLPELESEPNCLDSDFRVEALSGLLPVDQALTRHAPNWSAPCLDSNLGWSAE
jgi:hypothetical protein